MNIHEIKIRGDFHEYVATCFLFQVHVANIHKHITLKFLNYTFYAFEMKITVLYDDVLGMGKLTTINQ